MKLYQKFDLTQPWDSPVNRPLINEMPDIFRPTAYSPESISLDRGLTTMLSTAGAGGTMGAGGIERFREVIDGLSNTVFLVEADAKHAVEWTSNRDYDIGKMELPSGLAVSQGKVNIAFGDAWSGQARADLPTDLWRGLFTVAGEEPIYKDVRKIRQ